MATLQPVASASAHTLTHESCHHTIFRPFPTPQTWRQWMYLCGIQGFFAGLIDGGANFGIAYASEWMCGALLTISVSWSEGR